MRTREQRQTQGVGVFLDDRLDDLFRRLVQTGVDDLEAGVAERSRDDFGAAVVPIQTGLGDDDSVRAIHEVLILGNKREPLLRRMSQQSIDEKALLALSPGRNW